MTTPSITESEDQIYICGDSESLKALGETLILKAKMGADLSCTFTDGVNRPIRVEHIDDLIPANDLRDSCGD